MAAVQAWTWLRSRRLAAWLLVYLTAFFVVATLLPYGGSDDPKVAEWAREHPLLDKIVRPLGLYDPYTTPWFLVPALWLAVSTGACTIERALGGWATYRARWSLSAREVRRLTESPDLRVTIMADSSSEALSKAAEALRSTGLRVRTGPVALAASSNAIGILGSPLFHAAMTALFVFGLAGWLTRAEGGLNLLLERPVREVEENYLPGSSRGLLFGSSGYSGHELVLRRIVPQLVTNGVKRGPAVWIEVRQRGRTLARRLVYPNRPLVLGSMVVHFGGKVGPGAVLKVQASQGVPPVEIPVYFSAQPGATESRGFAPQRFTIGMLGGDEFQIEVAVSSGERISVRQRNSKDDKAAWSAPVIIDEGGSTTLSNGARVTAEQLTSWAQITVVHDWSVPFLYAMFVLGSVGVGLTVFFPFRSVKLRVVEGGQASGFVPLSAIIRAQKSDPGFGLRAREALYAAGFEEVD